MTQDDIIRIGREAGMDYLKHINEDSMRQVELFVALVEAASAAERERVQFPTMLRKMWSGAEVQEWLDENVNKEKNSAT